MPVAAAEAYDRHVTLTNNTDLVIVNVYASNIGTRNWEEDILHDGVIMPGAEVRMNINDGQGWCRFDFKVVYKDGTSAELHDRNVCDTGLTLTAGD